MHTEHTDVTYVVGAGPYPYRADGRRMSHSEAASYLTEARGMSPVAARRLLDMTATQAVRDAPAPEVERLERMGGYGREYRIGGADPVFRGEASRYLMEQWRLTPAEAAGVLDRAAPARI